MEKQSLKTDSRSPSPILSSNKSNPLLSSQSNLGKRDKSPNVARIEALQDRMKNIGVYQ